MAFRSPNAADAQSTGHYLKCRDVDGTSVIITLTATGLGAHTRWIYHEDGKEEENEENTMDVDDEPREDRSSTPPASIRRDPETPLAPHIFDAGSVLRTPAKKTRPLQRSPERIGFDGIDFWHDNSLGERMIEQTDNGPCLRYILRQPLGSTTNLSKEQLLELEFEQNQATFLTQVEKLLGRAEREKVLREMHQNLPAGKSRVNGAQLRFASPQPTIIMDDADQHLGSITIEGKEWEVYKTLRPRKDGQPRVIRSSPAQHKTRRARGS